MNAPAPASPPDPPIQSDNEASAGGITEGIRILLPFARDGWWRYAAAGVLSIATSICQLAVFYFIYRSVALLVGDGGTSSEMYGLALGALVSVVAQYVTFATAMWISHRAAFDTHEKLRLTVGDRLGRVPLGFLSNRRSGEIQRVLNDDIEHLELFLAHGLPDIVSSLASVAGVSVWLLLVDWRMALASLGTLFVAAPILSWGLRKSSVLMEGYTGSMARMNGSIVEMVRALPVIRTFNRMEDTFSETKEAVEAAARYQAGWGREFLPPLSLFFVLIAANAVVIIPVGLWLWMSEGIATETLLFFFIVGLGVALPIMRLFEFFAMIARLTFGARSVMDLQEATELAESPDRVDLTSVDIVLSKVSFSHATLDGGRRQVLDGINLSAAPGTVTALVGPSGSGKSTLAKLICRFWDVDSGKIEIGGHDIRNMPFDQLMEQVSFVFQDTFLFDETVAANIRFGRPDATDDDVFQAAQRAQAHEFILGLPQGYDTPLGERGDRLSGGERQRLAIARALLKDSPIVVLDEATAFADPENEAAIQDALGELISGRTLILIAHRLSTIVGADNIVVLDAPNGEPGRVVESGTHADLVAAGGLYSRLWDAFEAVDRRALGDAVRGEVKL